MQHYKANDKMLTIHPDRLITEWVLRDKITDADARGIFDYSLDKCPTYAADGREIPGLYHIERKAPGADAGEILPIGGFGAQFTILQNSDLYDMIANDILPALPGAHVETVGTLEGGATGLVQISAGKDFCLPGDESKHESRLYFNNPVGSGSLTMGFCLTRCICENTIAAARREVLDGVGKGTGYAIRHSAAIEVYAKRALAEIAATAKATATMQARLKALAKKQITEKTIKAALDTLIPATPELADKSPTAYTYALNRRNDVIDQWERDVSFTKDTAWKLVNAFTFPIFNPSRTAKNTDLSGIRFDAMFGERAARVNEILDTVERLAA